MWVLTAWERHRGVRVWLPLIMDTSCKKSQRTCTSCQCQSTTRRGTIGRCQPCLDRHVTHRQAYYFEKQGTSYVVKYKSVAELQTFRGVGLSPVVHGRPLGEQMAPSLNHYHSSIAAQSRHHGLWNGHAAACSHCLLLCNRNHLTQVDALSSLVARGHHWKHFCQSAPQSSYVSRIMNVTDSIWSSQVFILSVSKCSDQLLLESLKSCVRWKATSLDAD